MVATLSRSGTNSYAVSDRRSYDAWGQVRAQRSGGDLKLRYCANIGHRQDDESGLVYMRARYYEPSSGRFVSEDAGKQGRNWLSYCGDDPVNRADESGNTFLWDISGLLRAAFNTMMSSDATIIQKITGLKRLLDDMDWVVNVEKANGAGLISKGKLDQETAGLMGDLGAIEAKIGEIESGIGYEHTADGVVAQIGKRMIEIMMRMVQDDL